MKAPLAQQQALAGQTPYWVGPQQREKLRQQNEVAALLQQATLDTQQAQAKGVQLANTGRELQNERQRREFNTPAAPTLSAAQEKAQLYLPDGVNWGDASREQKRNAMQDLAKFSSVQKTAAAKPDTLRKEFTNVTKSFSTVDEAFGRITASAKDPSAAGDLALIFNYMKVLDPGSTVREGEFATAQNATGVPGQVRAMFNRIQSGERLNPEQRQDFVKRAQMLYDNALGGYDRNVKEFTRIAEGVGLDPSQVIFDRANYRGYTFDTPEAAPVAPPAAAPSAQGAPPLIDSQDAYDALPSGAIYTEADGKQYRKP